MGALPSLITLPAGGTLTYTVDTTLPTEQMSQSVDYTVTATLPPGFVDANPADNVASNSVLVAPLGPDLVVTVTESKSATDPAVTYTINVHNNGPGVAEGATVTYQIPAGSTLQDVKAGDGWTCSSTEQRVTCVRTAPIAAQADATPIVIKVLPPSGATTIPVDVTVGGTDGQGNPLSDPDPSSNTVSRTTDLLSLKLSGGGLAFGCSQSGSLPLSASGLELFSFALGSLILLRTRRRTRRTVRSSYPMN
jgi:uncharacterized repeat protein (TIGR01451 family)